MLRCYFHVLNGKRLVDDVGIEVADIEGAKLEAVIFTGTILMTEHPTDIWDGTPWEMKVTDQPSPNRGRTYLTLTVTAGTS
jgi:hypothetical protein